MFYTYSIKNIENGKFYIGSRTAKCMLNRKPEDDLGVRYFSSSKDKELRQAIKDCKVEYHVLQEYDDAKVCWKAEQQLIALYWKLFGKDMSYNHCYSNCNGDKIFSTAGLPGPKNMLGKHLSEETKLKMSKSRMGHFGWNKGMKHTEETKKKISITSSGENNGMFGKHHSEEAKLKMSIGHKGKDTWNKGKKMSAEYCEKMRKPRKKYYWQLPNGEIIIMGGQAIQWHKDWIRLEEVKNN